MKTRASEQPKQPEQRVKDGMAFRAATVECIRAEGDKPASVRMSVSSEAPVLTYTYFNDQYQRVWEILDHSPSSVDMSRCADGLVVLDRHYGDQVGLMAAKIDGRKLGGAVTFCSGERAKEIAEDAARGLRRNVSVGYRVDAASYRLDGTKDGVPVVRAMSWMPYEASFEPVPADTTVGVGRAAATVEAEAKPPAQGASVEPKNNETQKQEKRTMDPKVMAMLFARAAEHGIDADKVRALVEAGKGAAELDAMIVEQQRVEIKELRERKPDASTVKADKPAPLGGDAKTEEKIVRKYSLANVARALMGQRVDVGFENEVTQEVRRQFTGVVRQGQFTVPYAVLAIRATSLTEAGTSSYTVATDYNAAEFIDVLRPYSVLPKMGVRFMGGLVGDVTIGKKTAAGSGYWVSEESEVTRLAPTVGQVKLSPHQCGAACDVSYLLKMQSTPSADAMIRDDIVKSIATKVQQAFFATGGAGAPSPITSASGINNPSVTGGTPTYAEMLGFPYDIAADSATADGQLWVVSAATAKKLTATYNDGTTKSYPVLDPVAKTILGYPYLMTEDVGTNAAFFGDWSQVLIGTWGGGLEVKVDEATLSLAMGTRIVGMQLVDFAVRHGQALAYNTSVAA